MKDVLQTTQAWFEAAISDKVGNKAQIQTQFNCIKEEFNELTKAYEEGDQLEQLDALCDIIVTCVGKAYLNGWDIVGAMQEVNRSNFSKFENGKPIFREDGKIMKGPDFTLPELKPFLKSDK